MLRTILTYALVLLLIGGYALVSGASHITKHTLKLSETVEELTK